MKKNYLVAFLVWLLCFQAEALSVNIIGAQPSDKNISDSEILKIYWEADSSGTYTVTVSSAYMTERYVDNYKDIPYTSGISYTFTIDPFRDLVDETGNTVDDTYTVKVEFRSGSSVVSDTISFILDNPPEPPQNFTASPGDSYVHLSWSRHRDNDIKEFRIYYDTTPSPYPQSPTEADYINVKVVEGRETTGVDITGLDNGETYYFSIVAVDVYNNVSEFAAEISATPHFESGFSSFSDEDVGCVIARNLGRNSSVTRHLRFIKDAIFSLFPLAVRFYYSWSVSIVLQEKKGEYESQLVQGVFSIFAAVLHVLIYPEVGLTAIFGILLLFAGRKAKKAFFLILTALVLLFSNEAAAGSPMNFFLDIKAGNMKFYRTSGKERWNQIYGRGGHASIWGKFGYEVPWKKFGTFILSGTGGIFWESGYGLIQEESGEITRGGKDLLFYLFPLGVEFTYLARYVDLQYVVPFVSTGVTGYFFLEKKKNGSTIKKGTVGGYFWSAGALIQLDWVEPEYANKLDVDWGINHTYIILEYRWSIVDGFGKYSYFDFSNNTFFAGLAFEF